MAEETIQQGQTILTWFDDYGALKVLAMIAIVYLVATPFMFIYVIKKIAKPLVKIADWLDENPNGG